MAIILIPVTLIVAALLILKLYPPVGALPGREKQKEYAERSALFYDGKFHNENDYTVMTGSRSEESGRTLPEQRIPVQKVDRPERADAGELKVTWLGHSSALVQMGEKNILLDPVLSEYCAPVSVAGLRRFSDIPLDVENVPETDVVFISHDHYDHLDYGTIRAIDDRVRSYVVPLGIDVILTGWGVDAAKLHPLAWWESTELDGMTFTLVPAQHASARNPLRSFATLWGGIYIEDGRHSLYYTGDGGYYDVFTRVYERFGETDLMLADSAQYNDAWAKTHMTPEQSVQAAKDAHAAWLIPVHWGAFRLSTHAWDEPPRRAVKAADEQGVRLATPRIGQTVDYDGISSCNEHWWEDPSLFLPRE